MKRILIVFLLLPPSLFAQINANGDFQIWNIYSFEKKLAKKTALVNQTEFRFGDDASKLFVTYTQLQWVYTGNFLEIAPGYRQIIFRSEIVKWTPAYSPLIDITFHRKKAEVQLKNRNRIQYVMDRFKKEWVYRNRTRLNYDFKWGSFAIDDELFFIEKKGFSQNRFSLGFFLKATDHVKGHIFYMLRHDRPITEWRHQNILGLNLFLTF